MIGVANELPEHSERYELHRLLGALLSQELARNEKFNIIEKEYEIPTEENFREDVNIMCNLSEKIEENGIEIGRAEGRIEGKLEAEQESEAKMVKMIVNILEPKNGILLEIKTIGLIQRYDTHRQQNMLKIA